MKKQILYFIITIICALLIAQVWGNFTKILKDYDKQYVGHHLSEMTITNQHGVSTFKQTIYGHVADIFDNIAMFTPILVTWIFSGYFLWQKVNLKQYYLSLTFPIIYGLILAIFLYSLVFITLPTPTNSEEFAWIPWIVFYSLGATLIGAKIINLIILWKKRTKPATISAP